MTIRARDFLNACGKLAFTHCVRTSMAQSHPYGRKRIGSILLRHALGSHGTGQFTQGATATKSRERSTAVDSLVRPGIRDFSCTARRKIHQRLRQVVWRRLAWAETAALLRRTCVTLRHAA